MVVCGWNVLYVVSIHWVSVVVFLRLAFKACLVHLFYKGERFCQMHVELFTLVPNTHHNELYWKVTFVWHAYLIKSRNLVLVVECMWNYWQLYWGGSSPNTRHSQVYCMKAHIYLVHLPIKLGSLISVTQGVKLLTPLLRQTIYQYMSQ